MVEAPTKARAPNALHSAKLLPDEVGTSIDGVLGVEGVDNTEEDFWTACKGSTEGEAEDFISIRFILYIY